jgi:CBS domain-containing protein
VAPRDAHGRAAAAVIAVIAPSPDGGQHREHGGEPMSILRFAQSPPPSVTASTMVFNAVRVLQRSRSGALAVLDDGKLVGVLSERDLVHRVIGKGRDPAKTRVGDVMTRDVERVGENATLDEAYDLMSARHIRHLVVTDRQGRPVGLLSHRAIAQAEIESATSRLGRLPTFVGDSVLED